MGHFQDLFIHVFVLFSGSSALSCCSKTFLICFLEIPKFPLVMCDFISVHFVFSIVGQPLLGGTGSSDPCGSEQNPALPIFRRTALWPKDSKSQVQSRCTRC